MRCFCLTLFLAFAALQGIAHGDDWPQWRGADRDGIWRETGLLDQFPTDKLDWKWQVPIGSGYCGPTVARGRVYVMDRHTTGRGSTKQEYERVHCFDQETGRALWTFAYPCTYEKVSYTAGPRASVAIDRGRAIALGTMGHLHCLDAVSGKVIWKRDLRTDFRIKVPIWGIAASPLIFRDLVILHIGGRDGACVVALDAASGNERWRALNDGASYSAPIVIRQAGKPVVVVWNADAIAGLAAENGDVYWRIPFPPIKMPIGVPTPVIEKDLVFVSSFYDGSLMVQLDRETTTAKKLWSRRGRSERDTEALHCMISTPVLQDGYIYGVDSYGELRCLDAKTGERIWENTTATPRARWSNIHMVRQQDRVWMFNERGELLIARLSPQGFEEISRAQLIEPTSEQLSRGVCWSHPAFANQHIFARNDNRLVCASLAKVSDDSTRQ